MLVDTAVLLVEVAPARAVAIRQGHTPRGATRTTTETERTMLKIFRFESNTISGYGSMDIEESSKPNRFKITIRDDEGSSSIELTREDWEKIHQLGNWSSYGSNLNIKEEDDEKRQGLVADSAEGKEA